MSIDQVHRPCCSAQLRFRFGRVCALFGEARDTACAGRLVGVLPVSG